ncbi:unnamed protein product [Agarophyton chilense]
MKRAKSARSSSDNMFQECLTGLSSSMNRFAGSYERKVDTQQEFFSRKQKQIEEENQVLTGLKRETVQDKVKRTQSFLEVIRSLDETNVKYQDAIKRRANQAHIEYLKEAYELIQSLVSSMRSGFAAGPERQSSPRPS